MTPRRRGGQPGNTNALRTGLHTAAQRRRRAAWRAVLREARAVLADARRVFKEAAAAGSALEGRGEAGQATPPPPRESKNE